MRHVAHVSAFWPTIHFGASSRGGVSIRYRPSLGGQGSKVGGCCLLGGTETFFAPSIGKTPVRDDPRVEQLNGPCASRRQYARHMVHAGGIYENIHAKWHMYRCSELCRIRRAQP